MSPIAALCAFFLCRVLAEPPAPPPHRRLDVIPVTDPFAGAPPSSNINDGLWREAPQYGAFLYTKEQLDALRRSLIHVSALGTEAESSASPSQTPLRKEAASQPPPAEEMPQAEAPAKTSGKPETMPQGPLIPYRDAPSDSMVLNFMGRAAPVPHLNGRLGRPETLPEGPLIPYPNTPSDTMVLRFNGRPDPDLHVNPRLSGRAQTMPEGPTRQYPDPTADSTVLRFNGRSAPDLRLNGRLTGRPETMPDGPNVPYREASSDWSALLRLSGRSDPSLFVSRHLARGAQPTPSLSAAPSGPSTAGEDPEDWEGLERSAIPDLMEMVRRGPPKLRARAADELGRRGAEASAAIPVLEKALSDDYAFVKASAVLALGNIGGDAARLRALLAPYLKDKNPDVVMSARTALSRLR